MHSLIVRSGHVAAAVRLNLSGVLPRLAAFAASSAGVLSQIECVARLVREYRWPPV